MAMVINLEIVMTIKKYNALLSFIICFLSVILTAVVITRVLDISQQKTISEIKNQQTLNIIHLVDNYDGNASLEGILKAYLTDPKSRIQVYDKFDNLICDCKQINLPFIPKEPPEEEIIPRMNKELSQEKSGLITTQEFITPNNNKIVISSFEKVRIPFFTRILETGLFNYYLLVLSIAFVFSLTAALFATKKINKEVSKASNFAYSMLLDEKTEIPTSNIDEVTTINNILENLSSRLKIKQQSRKTLIDELVHQTRTPLTILRTHVEAYEDKIITLNEEEYKTLYREIDNLTSIITNISGFIEAGSEIEHVNIKSYDISEITNQISISLNHYFEKKKIIFIKNIEPKLCTKTDKYLLGQAIYNLLINAGKYTTSGKKVSLRCLKIKDEIVISVKDEGIGIDKKDFKNIFKAYYRGSNALAKEGDGLGLFLVKESADKTGAKIDLISTVNKGSEFILTLFITQK